MNKTKYQQGMRTLLALGLVVLVIIIGAVIYTQSNSRKNDSMTEEDEGMMQEEEVMRNDDAIIEEEQMTGEDNGMMEGDDTMMENKSALNLSGKVIAGSSAKLIDYNKADFDAAAASDKLVVLYFYANWCPICREEVQNALYPAFNELTRDDAVGFQVNYNDNQTDSDEEELAREHGVAYQHTKVFLKNGQRVLKSPESWDKSRYFEEIEKQLN